MLFCRLVKALSSLYAGFLQAFYMLFAGSFSGFLQAF
jgi:hypothetical protein